MPLWMKISWSISNCFLMILLTLFVILPLFPAQARTIWKIGKNNDSNDELYGLYRNQDIVCYEILEDYDIQEAPKERWEFPIYLSPLDLPLSPKEIHIIYTYLQDYKCPLLKIRASSEAGSTQLIVEKGGERMEATLTSTYHLYSFPLGLIHQGRSEGNKIILKNQSLSDNYVIFFDYLELDDQDEDNDWSLDNEECEGDTDDDGLEDKRDPDTAALYIHEATRIILDLQEKEDIRPYFQELNLLRRTSKNGINH